MRAEIPTRPSHIAAFLLLAFICYQAHQLTRHLVGAVLCGGFGSMTFAVIMTHEPCLFPALVTLSGPVLTYGLAWSGMFLLRSPKRRLFAYALIFGGFAHLRFIQTLTGRGDELILAQEWFGISNRIFVAALVLLIGLPPIVVAFRTIANRRRTLVFICSWLLPLPVLIVLLVGNSLLFGAKGDEIQGSTLAGIPFVVLIVDLLACILLIILTTRQLGKET